MCRVLTGLGKETAVNRYVGSSGSLQGYGISWCSVRPNPQLYMLVGAELLIDHHAAGLELVQGLAGAEHAG